MSWWIAAAFSCYAALLIWQAANQLETGIKNLVALPFLLAKLATMLVALAYWELPWCHLLADRLGWYAFGFALTLAIMEMAYTLKIVRSETAHPQKMRNFLMAFTLITTVLLPGIILVVAGRVLLLHECAGT